MDENEVLGTPAVETPAPVVEESLPTQAEALPLEPAKAAEKTPEPVKELSLREKIEKKAAEVAARDAVAANKDPKTGKFMPKTGEKPPVLDAKKGAEKPLVEGEKPAGDTPFSPTLAKIKVMDKEHDVPDFLKAAVKTPEEEKQLREIMEKAIGLDYVKPKYIEAREQAKVATQSFNGLLGQVQEAQALYAKGDMDGFFKRLSIQEEKVLQWLQDKVNYQQLPPEQKQVLDERRAAEERAEHAERQAQQYQTNHEQMLAQQVQMSLDSELAKSEVQQVAQAFDSRMGEGAFLNEVRRRGDYIWRTENKLVPPAQIVKEMMTFLGTPAPATPAAAATPTQAPAAPQVQAATPAASTPKTPVVPNISGRSASAVKTTIRSIDDIKKRSKELQNQQS